MIMEGDDASVRRLFLFLLAFLLLLANSPASYASTNSEITYLYTSTTYYVNQGNTALILPEGFRLSISSLTPVGRLPRFTRSVTPPSANDLDGNSLLVASLSPVAPKGNVTLSYALHIVRESRVIPEVAFSSSLDVDSIPRDLEAYCVTDGPWQGDATVLRALAAELQGSTVNASNVLQLVTHLADWIGTNVEAVSDDVPRSPVETYTRRQGDCDDQASLLVALCRILKIPAYLEIGCVRSSGHRRRRRTGISM